MITQLVLLLAVLSGVDLRAVPVPSTKNPYREYQVDCSDGSCQETILKLINRAENTIVLQGYEADHPAIARALFAWKDKAPNRVIGTILDAKLAKKPTSLCSVLAHNGVEVFLDSTHKKFTRKVMIIDNYIVITGKFLFNNTDHIEILHNQTIADVYFNEWSKHVKHSTRIYSSNSVGRTGRASR